MSGVPWPAPRRALLVPPEGGIRGQVKGAGGGVRPDTDLREALEVEGRSHGPAVHTSAGFVGPVLGDCGTPGVLGIQDCRSSSVFRPRCKE